jgi:hypothetical protein
MTKPTAPLAAASGDPDQRSAVRRPAASVPGITGLRISPHGIQAALVDISETGLLAECSERISANTAVTILVEGTFEPRSIEGRIARVAVSAMDRDGRLHYHVGIAFARPVDLEPHEVRPPDPEPEPAPVPVAASSLPPAAAEAAAESAVDAFVPETPDVVAADDPLSIEFEVPFPSEEVVRNRW